MNKNKKLEWYAFMEDFNSNELVYTNVLWSLDINKIKKMKTYNEIKTELKRFLMYRFWSKAEYEVIVRGLCYRPDRDNEFKIDIWYQLEPNLDRITEYVIRELNIKVDEK